MATPSPVRLLDLATGYQRSNVLFALIELEIPGLLARGPMTAAQLAVHLGADPLATDRFLNACAALGLLERERGEFRNSADVARFLVRGTATYLGDAFLRYDRASYPAWAGLAERLRTWRSGETQAPAPSTEDEQAAARAQHELSLLTGEALGSAIDFSRHRRLLDLGGGTGAMSIALCRAYTNLTAVVLERAGVADIARGCIHDSGLAARIEVAEGDFARDPLPAGCDAVLLANLLSIATPRANQGLLGRIFDMLPAGGRVLLSGWMLDDGRTSPLLPVLFCLEDINWGAPDVEHTAATYAAWLQAAGFRDIGRKLYFPPTSVVHGRKP